MVRNCTLVNNFLGLSKFGVVADGDLCVYGVPNFRYGIIGSQWPKPLEKSHYGNHGYHTRQLIHIPEQFDDRPTGNGSDERLMDEVFAARAALQDINDSPYYQGRRLTPTADVSEKIRVNARAPHAIPALLQISR
jgi:hypothetical protein